MSYEYINRTDATLSAPEAPLHGDGLLAGHHYPAVILDENASAHFGDVYHHYQGEPLGSRLRRIAAIRNFDGLGTQT